MPTLFNKPVQPARKSSTLSTTVNAPTEKDVIFPAAEPLTTPPAMLSENTRDAPSPVKWGFLAAAVTHCLNIFLSGLTSRAPWSCIHGSVNLIIAGLLAYVVYFWNKQFDTNLYVRRTLLRLSWALAVLMFATFLAHLTVVVAVSHGPAIGNGYYATSVGTIRSAAAFQPAISAVLVILWSAFAYVQFVAVENIRDVQLPVSRHLRRGTERIDVTIAEEMASTNAQPIQMGGESGSNDEPSSIGRFVSDSLIYYGPMLGAALIVWTFGFVLTVGAPHVAVAGYIATLAILCPMVFIGFRSHVHSLIVQSCSLAYAIAALLINLAPGFSAPAHVRWTLSVFTVAAQLIALGVSAQWYHAQSHEGQLESQKAPVTLFRRRRHPSADDPMDYFMAGVARKEDV